MTNPVVSGMVQKTWKRVRVLTGVHGGEVLQAGFLDDAGNSRIGVVTFPCPPSFSEV